MRKIIVFALIIASFAGGVFSTNYVRENNINLNPFKEPVYDCKYQYFLDNQIHQERWFDTEEKNLINLKAGDIIEGLKVIEFINTKDEAKTSGKFLIITEFNNGKTILNCTKRNINAL